MHTINIYTYSDTTHVTHMHIYTCVQGYKHTQPGCVVGCSVAWAYPGTKPLRTLNSTEHTGPFVRLLELSSPSPAYFLLGAVGDTVPGQHQATAS